MMVAPKKAPAAPPLRPRDSETAAAAAVASALLDGLSTSGEVAASGAADRDPFDLVGDVIDSQFRVEEVAGAGRLTVVYRGHHCGVDAPVAIKCLDLPQTVDRALFEPVVRSFREGCRLHYKLARGSLDIVQTLASGTTLAPRGGTEVSYVVREWLEGHPLATELAWRRSREPRKMPLAQAMALLEGAARGLAHAHAQGVAHLALDTTNLFVVISGKERRTKILDFGIAAAMGQGAAAATTAGLQLVAPQYAAPEQMDRTLGAAGPRTDVYALAIILLEALAGRAAIPEGEGATATVLDPKKRPTPKSLGVTLPRAVEAELERAVALAPAQRHADVGAFWSALERAHKPALAAAAPAPAPAPAPEVAKSERITLHGLPPLVVAPEPEAELELVPDAEPEPPRAPALPSPMAFASPAIAAPPPARRIPTRMPPRAALMGAAALGALAQIALVAFVLSLGRHAETPSAQAATASPTATIATPPPPKESAPPAATMPPAPHLPPFNRYVATNALRAKNAELASCPRDKGLWGKGAAVVIFGQDGAVSSVQVGPPFAGTAQGDCVAKTLATASAPAYSGQEGRVYFLFFIPMARK